MILEDSIMVLSLFFTIFLKGITAASFSNVYVQSKPLEFFNYGVPPVTFAGQEIAEISAAPVNNVIPLESVKELVSPCVAPCVIPGPSITALPPQARASIITYKSPVDNIPIVLENKNDAISYQYSYAVYDEHTGDQKSQSEQSDGSVVRGQYSLIEPNGARREVTYTADDIKGFNAVVRNILPANKPIENGGDELGKKLPTPPCNEVMNEQLKEEPEKDDKGDKESKDDKGNDDNSETHVESTIEVTAKDVETTPQENLVTDEVTTEQPEESEKISTEPSPELTASNHVVSYSDIIKCLQAKFRGINIENDHQINLSPLSYILLPAFNTKLCEI